ncbi:MAG: DJ-1/PfpI family protein [Alphaproteobacteria bacterium]
MSVRISRILLVTAMVALMGVCAFSQGDAVPKAAEGGAKAVLVIAPKKFNDTELRVTQKVLKDAGVEVTLASTTTKPCIGMQGARVKPDVLVKDVNASDYDLVAFIGGSGTTALFKNPDPLFLARAGVKEKKIVAAICIAPCILANAGVLKGKKATVFPGNKFIRLLRRGGAIYQRKPVVRDGDIITANGPKSAKAFGNALVKALKKE